MQGIQPWTRLTLMDVPLIWAPFMPQIADAACSWEAYLVKTEWTQDNQHLSHRKKTLYNYWPTNEKPKALSSSPAKAKHLVSEVMCLRTSGGFMTFGRKQQSTVESSYLLQTHPFRICSGLRWYFETCYALNTMSGGGQTHLTKE